MTPGQHKTQHRRTASAAWASSGTAGGTPSPAEPTNSDDELLTRVAAAALLSELWGGVPVAPRSVAAWPIPYRLIGHASLYRRGDLVQHARRKLQNAPLRTGGGVAAVRRA